MRILFVFTALVLTFFILTACGPVTLPSEVHVKGEAEVRVNAKINIGSIFTDILENSVNNNDNMSILPCIKTSALTYVIYMPLFPSDGNTGEFSITYDELSRPVLPVFPGMTDIDIGNFFKDSDLNYSGAYELESDKDLINPNSPLKLPLSSIGDLLDGFEFDRRYQAKLYFSGTDLLDKLATDITINEKITPIPSKKMANTGDITIENKSSGWNQSWGGDLKEYTGTTSPNGGLEVDIPLDGNDVIVDFRVYLPKGTKLEINDFINGQINIELVIWLPLVFKSVKEGAVIELPKGALFSASDDVFGRTNEEEKGVTQYIERMSLNIEFNENPFKGSELVVTSKAKNGELIEIKRRLSGNSLVFSISEEDLIKINLPNNWPFIPDFKMIFSQGAVLSLPRDFKTKTFVFNALINQKFRFMNEE